MKLVLQREPSTPLSTPGQIFLYGVHECYTLEDPVRDDPDPTTPENEVKLPGITAIPPGTYKVIVNRSPKFGKLLPRLIDVPGYSGILIHPGNTAEDTSGCILPGTSRSGPDKVVQSRKAFDRLFTRITTALSMDEEVWLEIRPATKAG